MELIKLSINLGLEIIKILQAKGIEPLKNQFGTYSLEFTQEQLDMITHLNLYNPTFNLQGIEYLKNLENLKIETQYMDRKEYVKFKNRASINNDAIKRISKLKRLKSLSIIGQTDIDYIDVSNLTNLVSLEITGNSNLVEIEGLECLEKIEDITIFDNNELFELEKLNELFRKNNIYEANIDLFYFRDLMYRNGILDTELKDNLEVSTINFLERVGLNKVCKTSINEAVYFDKKCEDIIDGIRIIARNKRDYIVAIEKYIAENITYDDDALKNRNRYSGNIYEINGHKINIASGSANGTNGAVNGVLRNKCVCEGYTRTMQHLLKILGIKSKNIYCIATEDTIGMSSKNLENEWYKLPIGERHSIIRVDDENGVYYCDPCWDACYYQSGIKTFPWLLLTKKEISKDHMLSFDEKNIIYDISIPRSEIEAILSRLDNRRKNR